ncbi:hypothetical protein J3D54_003934 [Pseudomonas sp. GGS8]|uniref:hypothetical protein n=1 Tax=Pseudomonas sp. GGS8 TaxID=2817892 RepID=UPI0020A0E7D0|nr:hypothetical protein [Pseudomonas sp. GGS8]MCP1444802.1 hypothetical protein [Pseudomonas sp. GGS8]
MSRLSMLIAEARSGLSTQERIPHEKWAAIASQCGAAETVEIERRVASLRAELETIEAWDGDTMDDINIAINHFSQLLRMAAGAL